MKQSRIPGFYRLTVQERRAAMRSALRLANGDLAPLTDGVGLPLEIADTMVENVVGTFGLPFGVGLNFLINGRDYVLPMVVEEPSVVAAASNAALLARAGGGFHVETDDSIMIGQIQLVEVSDPVAAIARVRDARDELLKVARRMMPGLCKRGGGPRDIEARLLETEGGPMVIVHVLVDTGDAMGANAINSLVERLAPLVGEITGGTTCLRILSNLADRRLARARVRIPISALARGEFEGSEVAARIVLASQFAAADPYRAATHNKGIMNGVDAVALATGNDWRAIEAAAHAFACRDGAYRSLSSWHLDGEFLVGTLTLPMAVSTVGPVVQAHPLVKVAFRILGVSTARELAGVLAAVGLASNLAAIRALATEGIQKGHMALHARAVLEAAGARGALADELRQRLVAGGEVKIERARQLLAGG